MSRVPIAAHCESPSQRDAATNARDERAPRSAVLTILVFLALALGAHAQAPRTITNVARLSFATAGGNTEFASNPVNVIVSGSTAWTVAKSASTLTPANGADVTFTVRATPTVTPFAIAATVDGAPRQLLILRDIIPTGTTFVRFKSLDSSAVALYHRSGDPLHSYVSAAPATVDSVATGLAALPAGGSLTLRFDVKIASQTDEPINNVAQIFSALSEGGEPVVQDSNVVTLNPRRVPPAISYFNDDFSAPIEQSVLGTPLFLQARALVCNTDPARIERAEITLTSARTGDRETFTAVETGRDTGVFRILPNVPTSAGTASPGDGTMQTAAGDTITARIDCGGGITASTQIIIAAPAGGAGLFVQKLASRETAEIGDFIDYTVAVKNVSGGPLDDVILDDALPFGFNFVENSARRGIRKLKNAGGSGSSRLKFSVGEIKDGESAEVTYRVRIGPGAQQGNGENRVQAASGSPRFRSNVATARVLVQGGVFSDRGVIIGKVFIDANRSRVQDRGEDGVPGVRLFIEDGSYAITDSEGKYNFYGVTPSTHVVKVDRTTLPTGAVLEPLGSRNAGSGTTRFVDLKRGEMHKADFAISNPTPAMLAQIEKRRDEAEKAGSEIAGGLGHELSREGAATGPSDPRSLPASGTLGVGGAPFQGSNVAPREGFISRSLPPANVGSTTGNAGTSGFASGLQTSPFERGEPARGAVTPSSQPSPAAPPRNDNGINLDSAGTHEASRPQRDGTFPYEAPSLPTRGSEPASEATHLTLFPDDNLAPSQSPALAVSVPSIEPQASFGVRPTALPADNTLAFLDLRDGDTLPSTQTSIRVKGRVGGAVELRVNGEKIPAFRLGKKSELADTQTTVAEYVGIDLRPGPNALEVVQRDQFGNERGSARITVTAPDKLGRIEIAFANAEPVADGKTPAKVRVALVDANGVAVATRTSLTLEASLGVWQVRDLDESAPGVQVFIEGGRAEYALVAPIEPGDARLRVASGALVAETTLPFLPELRDLLAVGVIEGRINFNKLGRGSIQPLRSGDAFERELREFSTTSGDLNAGARAAFFIKGRIKGNYLLTAAYDSDKDTKERLFRDIQPDEFYPVYGDSSVKGFDAQSTGKLYVRIDNKRSYLLYGDFTTQAPTDARQLGNYNRSLTGVREHFENKWVSANAWASYDTTRQVIEEIPGNGTSGPYSFRTANGLINSEKVEVLVRDRNQPALIIETRGMARFSDYEFEPFTGRLLFREPVPTLDENLNPISIRITYEVDQGGDKFWVYGADAQVKLGDRIELGGAAVRDENPQGAYSLYSGNAVVDLGMRTFLLGEVARSEDELRGDGNAYRLELRHQSEKLAGRVFWSRADQGFYNPAATLSAGRIEAGAQVTYKLGPKTRALLHALDSESLEFGERRGVLLGVEHAFSQRFRLEVGGRYSHETTAPASLSTALTPDATPNEVKSARIRLTLPVPWVESARIYGEYEQDVTEADKRLAAIGGDYQVDDKTRLYARWEYLNSLGGPFEINSSQAHYSTVVGVDSAYMKNGALFNEYRVRNGISGREAEGAVGLRNRWTLAEGVRASTTVERIAPVKGVRDDNEVRRESTAVTGAIELTYDPRWKATGRLEYRTSESQDSWLNTLGYARKVNEDWTFLARSIFFRGEGKGASSGDKTEGRFQMGAAWRQTEINKWNALGRYEYRYEKDTTTGASHVRRDVHVISMDVNYQPSADWIWSAHYGGKYALDRSGSRDDTGAAHLLSGRVIYDVSKRFDAGLNVSGLFTGDASSVQFGVGPEIGFRVADNVRLALGYNVFGFRDEDLTESEYTEQGFYIALRMKFDETLLQRRKEEEGK